MELGDKQESEDVKLRRPESAHDPQTVDADEHAGMINYPIMGRLLLGWWGEQLGSWSVTLQQLGVCTAYIVIIAGVLTEVIKLSLSDAQRYQVQLLALCIIFPLTLLRHMDSLK